MAADGSPWSARRVGDEALQETVRKVLLTYWNTVSFHALYARANDWTPAPTESAAVATAAESGCGDGPSRGCGGVVPPALKQRHILDRWLVSATNVLVREVTDALENFDTQRTGQLLAAFIDDLSNWYVRRSRRRFWAGDPSALWTLHETLEVLTRLTVSYTHLTLPTIYSV